jgi:hypothetical protein
MDFRTRITNLKKVGFEGFSNLRQVAACWFWLLRSPVRDYHYSPAEIARIVGLRPDEIKKDLRKMGLARPNQPQENI